MQNLAFKAHRFPKEAACWNLGNDRLWWSFVLTEFGTIRYTLPWKL